MTWGRVKSNPFLRNKFEAHVFGPDVYGLPVKGVGKLNILLIDRTTIKLGNLRKLTEFVEDCSDVDNLDIIIGVHSKSNLERLLFTLNWILFQTKVGDIKSSKLRLFIAPLYKVDEGFFDEIILEERLNIEIYYGERSWPSTFI